MPFHRQSIDLLALIFFILVVIFYLLLFYFLISACMKSKPARKKQSLKKKETNETDSFLHDFSQKSKKTSFEDDSSLNQTLPKTATNQSISSIDRQKKFQNMDDHQLSLLIKKMNQKNTEINFLINNK